MTKIKNSPLFKLISKRSINSNYRKKLAAGFKRAAKDLEIQQMAEEDLTNVLIY